MKRGDVVEFKEDVIPRLAGVKCQIVRISRKTGGFTVKLVTAGPSEAYPVGTELHVQPYEVRPAMETR